jgi:predicted nucleic acid-binding Zn ribbon protein
LSANRGKLTRVGDALRGYLNKTGFGQRLEQAGVVDEWPSIVGDKIAAISQPEAVTREGTLFVRVTSAPWMQELQLLTPELLKRMGSYKVRRIVWRAW